MKVSVIVPVYNVEKYLNKCIDSIIVQTYKDLEIILVDDGSKDNSGYICDFWGKKDNRIKVLHKANGGLSDARNYGIECATGDYFTFIDSDDYIHEKMIELLVDALEKNDADISICDFERVQDDKGNFVNVLQKEELSMTGKDAVEKRYKYKDIRYVTAWAKLYKKHLFEEYRYPVGKIHEDEFLTYKLLYTSDKVVFLNLKLYFYRQRESSIIGQLRVTHMHAVEAMFQSADFFYSQKERKLYKLSIDNAVAFAIMAYNQRKRTADKQYDDDIIYLKKLIKNKYIEGLRKNALSISYISKMLFLVNSKLYRDIIVFPRKICYMLKKVKYR